MNYIERVLQENQNMIDSMKFNEIKDFDLNYAQKTQIVSNDLLELQLNENLFRNMNASFD